MRYIRRNMTSDESTINGVNEFYECQASFNSDGFITLRNYKRDNKDKDEIIILSRQETEALFQLFSRLDQNVKDHTIPF